MNSSESQFSTLHPGSLVPEAQAHDEIESASQANVPMFMAALCASVALALMGAAVWFAGKFAVAGALRLFSALAA